MDVFDFLTLIGGLCLFLFGMNLMSSLLEKQASGKLKTVLSNLTNNPIKGFALGLGVTAVIQSSSAATVMLVGLVNAGILTLKQTISVIMGANVGTTVTAWLLSLTGIHSANTWIRMFNPSSFTPILALFGVSLMMFSKSSKKKDIGAIILGFVILMFGMKNMSEAVSGLKDLPKFQNILLIFSNPILGVLAGTVLTAIIQSSSASVGILQVLSSTGVVSYAIAIPIIMGQNIGACSTALISAAGASKDGKRTAMVHLYFNIIGTIVLLGMFSIVKGVFNYEALNRPASIIGIAIIHTSFNLITTMFLLPASGALEKLARVTVRNAPEPEEFRLLEERLIASPAIAIARCKTITVTMATLSVDAIKKAVSTLSHFDAKTADAIREIESKVDKYEDRIGSYLIKVSSHPLTDRDSHDTTKLLRFIGDFERISDHAVNILESAEEIKDKKITFSDEAKHELGVLTAAVSEVLDLTLSAFDNEDLETALLVEPLEQVVDFLKEQIKLNHTLRLQKNMCSIEHGFVLSDILTDLERVSDHCSNIAALMLEISKHEALEMHKYLASRKAGSEDFDNKYNEYKQKYSL